MKLPQPTRMTAVLSGALLLLCTPLRAQSLPHTETKNLSEKKVVFPDDIRGHASLFIIGFSRKSKEPTSVWAKKATATLSIDPWCVVYQIAVLQDVPRIIRGMVISSIRSDVPNDRRDYFLIALEDESQWKQVTDFSNADDAYLLLADKSGTVVWRTHGSVTDTAMEDLRQKVNGLQ